MIVLGYFKMIKLATKVSHMYVHLFTLQVNLLHWKKMRREKGGETMLNS